MSTAKDTHLPALQSLRGLAALLVAVSHISLVYRAPSAWRIGIDTVLNAHAAVVLFFVLSGYVLTASLLREGVTGGSISRFYSRRLFRIYPAVWAVSALGLAVILLAGRLPTNPEASPWFVNYMSPDDVSLKTVALSALALKNTLIPPIGTIFTELVGSFFLPWLLLSVIRWPRWAPVLLVVLVGGAFALSRAPHRLDALSYLIDFALGMMVVLAPTSWRAQVGAHAGSYALGSLVVALLCRQAYYMVASGAPQPIEFDYSAPWPALIEAFASAVLVFAVAEFSTGGGFLGSRPLVWLGDVSYSVYLLHFPVVVFVARAVIPMAGLSAPAATGILLVTALGVTLLLASLSFTYVEKPGIRAGKKLAALVRGRRPAPAIAAKLDAA